MGNQRQFIFEDPSQERLFNPDNMDMDEVRYGYGDVDIQDKNIARTPFDDERDEVEAQ